MDSNKAIVYLLLIFFIDAPTWICCGPISVRFGPNNEIAQANEQDPLEDANWTPCGFENCDADFLERAKKEIAESIKENGMTVAQMMAAFDLGADSEQLCPICRDNLESEGLYASLFETPCKHVFHERCFDKWQRAPPVDVSNF